MGCTSYNVFVFFLLFQVDEDTNTTKSGPLKISAKIIFKRAFSVASH